MLNRAWATDIRGARTVQAILGFLRVDELVRGMVLQPDTEDHFVWRFGSDGVYTASSAYRAIFFSSVKLRGCQAMQKYPAVS